MSSDKKNPSQEFEKALKIGRPPNIVQLFPNSRALIVSGKVIDRAMIRKGKAMTIAANGRNHMVIRGALAAAQRANAAILIEIAKSEGGGKCLLSGELLEHGPAGGCGNERAGHNRPRGDSCGSLRD